MHQKRSNRTVRDNRVDAVSLHYIICDRYGHLKSIASSHCLERQPDQEKFTLGLTSMQTLVDSIRLSINVIEKESPYRTGYAQALRTRVSAVPSQTQRRVFAPGLGFRRRYPCGIGARSKEHIPWSICGGCPSTSIGPRDDSATLRVFRRLTVWSRRSLLPEYRILRRCGYRNVEMVNENTMNLQHRLTRHVLCL